MDPLSPLSQEIEISKYPIEETSKEPATEARGSNPQSTRSFPWDDWERKKDDWEQSRMRIQECLRKNEALLQEMQKTFYRNEFPASLEDMVENPTEDFTANEPADCIQVEEITSSSKGPSQEPEVILQPSEFIVCDSASKELRELVGLLIELMEIRLARIRKSGRADILLNSMEVLEICDAHQVFEEISRHRDAVIFYSEGMSADITNVGWFLVQSLDLDMIKIGLKSLPFDRGRDFTDYLNMCNGHWRTVADRGKSFDRGKEPVFNSPSLALLDSCSEVADLRLNASSCWRVFSAQEVFMEMSLHKEIHLGMIVSNNGKKSSNFMVAEINKQRFTGSNMIFDPGIHRLGMESRVSNRSMSIQVVCFQCLEQAFLTWVVDRRGVFDNYNNCWSIATVEIVNGISFVFDPGISRLVNLSIATVASIASQGLLKRTFIFHPGGGMVEKL